MGFFCLNVQVHTGSLTPAEARSRVIEALRRCILANSFIETTPEDAEADRVVRVAAAGAEPWIAIYDDWLDYEDPALLAALTQAVSTAVGGAALGILVYHSDLVELYLYRQGALADAYSSNPDFYGKVSAQRRKELRGRPECWQELLVAGQTSKELRALWREKPLDAEETVQMVPLLGLNLDLAMAGFLSIPEGRETTSLYFRLVPHAVGPARVQGLPAFKPTSYSPPNGAFSPAIRFP